MGIGVNPGVGLRPSNTDKRIDSQMFVFRKSDTNQIPSNEGKYNEGEGDLNADYAARMMKFLYAYNDYNYNSYSPYKKFDVHMLGDCKNYPYGYVAQDRYSHPSPCIFIKLNKIWGWDPKELPPLSEDPRFDSYDYGYDRFPEAVIRKYNENGSGKKDIIVNCEGRNAADQEALQDMEYYPSSQVISS